MGKAFSVSRRLPRNVGRIGHCGRVLMGEALCVHASRRLYPILERMDRGRLGPDGKSFCPQTLLRELFLPSNQPLGADELRQAVNENRGENENQKTLDQPPWQRSQEQIHRAGPPRFYVLLFFLSGGRPALDFGT